jgi:hypothetical protein
MSKLRSNLRSDFGGVRELSLLIIKKKLILENQRHV